ncbi:hypothetical protein BASA62_005675 [Batrachochytrium salamandrivorans]|nr:hypothetical protein BASA62_005675 [Batrachochytrium salamandrivorans]
MTLMALLLARRTVDPDPMDLLWKRADEDQMQLVPFGSRAGASNSEGSSSSSSGNSGSARANNPPKSVSSVWDNAKKNARWDYDEKRIQKANGKLIKVVQGQSRATFITDICDLLRDAIRAAREGLQLYVRKGTTPFSLLIPSGENKRSLNKAMIKLQKAGKKAVLTHRILVSRAIRSIIKHPEGVLATLNKIVDSILALHKTHQGLYDKEYAELISRVGRENNEDRIKRTQEFMGSIRKHRKMISVALYPIKIEVSSGGVTFKENAQGKKTSKFGAFKSKVNKGLGRKSKSSTGVTSTQEPSDQGPPNQGPPNQESSNQESSDEKPPNQESSNQEPSDEKPSNSESSNQGPPDQQAPDQAGTRPIPPPRRKMVIRQATIV